MSEEEDTRVCGYCKKAVAAANLALHESHCSRFLCLCPECDENVPLSELEEHKQEQHAQVKCSKCRKKMERRFLAEHEESSCPQRIEACEFCELEMTWTQLQEHTLACGSRTELCLECNRYVKLSESEEHKRTCLDQDQHQDLYNEPEEVRGAQELAKTDSSSKDLISKSKDVRARTKRPASNDFSRKQKVLCKFCLLTYPAEEIQKHEMTCTDASKWNYEYSDPDHSNQASGVDFLHPRFKNLDLPQTLGANSTRETPRKQYKEPEDPDELSICPHCQLTLPWITLRWHVDKCKLHLHLKHREATV